MLLVNDPDRLGICVGPSNKNYEGEMILTIYWCQIIDIWVIFT